HELADGKPERAGTYWTAQTDISKYKVHAPWSPSDPIFAAALASPTRLAALETRDQVPVIQAGYAFADAAMRSFVVPGAPPPAGAPKIV
ncbi:MAG: hypothetical protein AAF677_14345, partial [Pseudomonadota bacterium]